MYGREKLTIKGRFSDVCFRQKMLSGPKDRSFTPPGEFTGRRSETHRHKRKVEISPLSGKTRVELKFTPETKKPTRRPVGGEF